MLLHPKRDAFEHWHVKKGTCNNIQGLNGGNTTPSHANNFLALFAVVDLHLIWAALRRATSIADLPTGACSTAPERLTIASQCFPGLSTSCEAINDCRRKADGTAHQLPWREEPFSGPYIQALPVTSVLVKWQQTVIRGSLFAPAPHCTCVPFVVVFPLLLFSVCCAPCRCAQLSVTHRLRSSSSSLASK